MKAIAVLLAASLLIVGCASKDKVSQSVASAMGPNDLAIATVFLPDPPTQGSETLSVTVSDAAGAPVKGASVTVTTAMPTMSMTGPSLVGHDNGDGTYSVKFDLNYATTWRFDVSAKSGSKNGTAHVTREVQ